MTRPVTTDLYHYAARFGDGRVYTFPNGHHVAVVPADDATIQMHAPTLPAAVAGRLGFDSRGLRTLPNDDLNGVLGEVAALPPAAREAEVA